ncbi:MAG: cob(I)yrinic acid a,c-diamide adenosyltransferase [Firmicutes bacterium]|nr:cob(I)yrinic acid a,c-diamide adenosyltransferase [Bacillota bacterium]
MSFGKGYVQVYTGNGKGKTTAAIGLAIRALGADKRVLFLQFMKDKTYSEHNLLPHVSPAITLHTLGKPFFVAREGDIDEESLEKWKDRIVIFPPGQPPQEYVDLLAKGLEMAKEALNGGDYDLVVLDEINVALHYGLIATRDVLAALRGKRKGVEVVLTGRNAPPEIIEYADLVTEMREIKHYYEQGINARRGIES